MPVPGARPCDTRGQLAGAEALIDLAYDTVPTRRFPVVEPYEPAPVTAVPSPAELNRDQLSGRHRRRPKSKVSAGGIVTVAAVLVAGLTVARLPAAQWLVYVAWLTPFVELAMLVAGQVAFRWRFREAPPDTFTQAIIQITTTGAEYARVNEIIDQIRSYTLKIDYQVWVVIEPGHREDYPFADRVLVVPKHFTADSQKKARALEYSRRVRNALGLDRADVKIIFNDDDVSLTQAYIERAFAADYDICEGVVTPRTAYALRPLGHFLTSHADDIRTHACLVYCSVFQGIFRRPVHVHGEGLVVTGEAERIVTWNWPAIASEDLVFGQRAVRAGLKWGWFHEYAEVTSPWSLRDYFIQRRRWLWGDIHAIRRRKVMPLSSALIVLSKYLAGVIALLCSGAGLYLRATGRIPATAGVLTYAKLAVLAWTGLFFSCGWIGASSAESARSRDSRLLSGTLAVLMMPVSLVLTLAAIAIPLIQGDPRSFAVISKTRKPR
jgi:Glycosyl transferase family group 2